MAFLMFCLYDKDKKSHSVPGRLNHDSSIEIPSLRQVRSDNK